jgi:hypothetical protein
MASLVVWLGRVAGAARSAGPKLITRGPHPARAARSAEPAAACRSIGYDNTRLIALIDELERRGLVAQEPDAPEP